MNNNFNNKQVYVDFNSPKYKMLAAALVAVLMLTVGSASYAYFASSVSASSSVNISMNALPNASLTSNTVFGTCVGSGTGTATANAITSVDMQQSAVNTTAKTSATSSNIVMTATPPNAAVKLTCSYNIQWAWTTTNGYTQSTSLGSNKELTYQLQKWNGSAWADVVAETQFPTAANTSWANIKTGESVAGNGAAATATYHIILRWYNANLNQDTHKGKTYTGHMQFASISAAHANKS